MPPFARAWKARGTHADTDVRVCCLKSIGGNPFEAELRALGVPVVNLGARNLRDLGAFRRLLRLLRSEEIDLIHAHLAYASLWGTLASRLTGIPCFATLHVPPSGAPARSREGIREALLVRTLDRWATRVIAVSRSARDAWVKRGGLAPSKIVVVGNGIEVEAFSRREGRDDIRRELGIEPAAPLVTTVSVLRPGKGIEVLLDAVPAILAVHPDTQFLIAGDGPLRKALEKRRMDRVVWAGFRRDIPALLAASDIFVLPSLADAYPTVLLEAMAAGLPVVSTRVGGIPEIVDDPHTGRLVPPGDAGALASGVSALLASPEERAALGRAAQEEARAGFSTAAWVERLAEVYGPHPLSPSPISQAPNPGRGGTPAHHPGSEMALTARLRPPSPGGGVGGRWERGTGGEASPPRLALVEFAGRGGMIHYAWQLCRALAGAGADVTLITSRHYELDALPHPFRLRKVLRLWDPKPSEDVGPIQRRLRRLRRILRAAVHYREWARLAFHLWRERPDLVQLGDIRFPGDLLPILLLRLLGLRLVDVCHNVSPYTTGGRAAGLFRHSAVDRFLYRRIYRRFERVFVHFEDNRRAFLADYGLPPERVIAIPHGNEEIFEDLRDPGVDEAALRREAGLAPGEPVILLFGTLSRYKGADLLLAAFARIVPRVPGARLVLAGFPSADFDLPAHQELARELGIEDRVRWVPRYVESGEVAAWMELASVAVFPYREVYQSGALAVAQTFGAPVVASAVGAMPQVIEDGQNGLLVPPGDVDALASALLSLLEDPDLARRLGDQGRRDARERFGWDRIAGTILDACRQAPALVPREMEAPR